MGKLICKFEDGPTEYYLEWSTVVDAPITFGMSLEDFKEYYLEEYGRNGMEFDFQQRMERVEKYGTSSHLHSSVDDLIAFNRAGNNETRLTKDQIIDWYCRKGAEDYPQPEGDNEFAFDED